MKYIGLVLLSSFWLCSLAFSDVHVLAIGSSITHFGEVVYRVGDSAGIPVVPARQHMDNSVVGFHDLYTEGAEK